MTVNEIIQKHHNNCYDAERLNLILWHNQRKYFKKENAHNELKWATAFTFNNGSLPYSADMNFSFVFCII